MSVACVLSVLVLVQVTQSQFTPVEWNTQVSSSQQCGSNTNPDLTSVLTTVANMVLTNNPVYSLPKSCVEIKDNSPSTPSEGYYTIMDANNSTTNIVYCSIDDFSTYASLEQAYQGLKSDYQSLSSTLTAIENNYNNLSTTTSQGFSGLQNDLDTLSNTVTTNYQYANQSFTDLEDNQQNLVANTDITSCEDVKNKWPWSTSGWYLIVNSTGSTHNIYCHMGERCNTNGPWTRVAYLDMTDDSQTCPSDFFIYNQDGVRACGKSHPISGGCTGTIYSTNPSSYTQICGQVIGYQFRRPDGTADKEIDSTYVDGVSLTRGSPRQHIWTFAAEFADESGTPRCAPCAGGNNPVPSFIGNDVFCESGNHAGSSTLSILYTDDRLWDGQQCGSDEVGCCDVPGPPWFRKTLDAPTDDYIELRVCGNASDEDSPVEIIEIYVK